MNNTPQTKIVKQVANFSHVFSKPCYFSFKAIIISLINFLLRQQINHIAQFNISTTKPSGIIPN